jgi:hypothetical protein
MLNINTDPIAASYRWDRGVSAFVAEDVPDAWGTEQCFAEDDSGNGVSFDAEYGDEALRRRDGLGAGACDECYWGLGEAGMTVVTGVVTELFFPQCARGRSGGG